MMKIVSSTLVAGMAIRMSLLAITMSFLAGGLVGAAIVHHEKDKMKEKDKNRKEKGKWPSTRANDGYDSSDHAQGRTDDVSSAQEQGQ